MQRSEREVGRSRFVTTLAPARDERAAREVLDAARAAFPDAGHHAWAMIAGAPDDLRLHGQSDDGEPRGTAGAPMLTVLRHSGLGQAMVVVTRYFGGVKLGTGGLARAYARSVSGAIDEASLREVRLRDPMDVGVPYALLDTLEHWLATTDIAIAHRRFTDVVHLRLLVPPSERERLARRLRELGRGTLELRRADGAADPP